MKVSEIYTMHGEEIFRLEYDENKTAAEISGFINKRYNLNTTEEIIMECLAVYKKNREDNFKRDQRTYEALKILTQDGLYPVMYTKDAEGNDIPRYSHDIRLTEIKEEIKNIKSYVIEKIQEIKNNVPEKVITESADISQLIGKYNKSEKKQNNYRLDVENIQFIRKEAERLGLSANEVLNLIIYEYRNRKSPL